jgi:hypothetical protein
MGENRPDAILCPGSPPPATAVGIDVPGGQNKASYQYRFSADPEQFLYIEDLWTPDNCDSAYTDKENAIGANIRHKQGDRRPNHLYMTFTSWSFGSAEPPFCNKTPQDFADNVNPWFVNNLKVQDGPVGIVIMDFPGDDMIGLIIDSNNY